MAAFATRRPTRDIDLRASGFANDVAECERRIRQIVAIGIDDGLIIDPASVRDEVIRDEADYTGVRVHVKGTLASAHIAVHVDISFGDPIWPAAELTDVPRLLGGSVRLLGYPDHMVLAEKIVTAIQRGTANTRWRDFVDIDSIPPSPPDRRSQPIPGTGHSCRPSSGGPPPLVEMLAGMAETAQPKWLAWRRKQHLETTTPEQFQALLDRCAAFADPVLSGEAAGLTWNPDVGAWA